MMKKILFIGLFCFAGLLKAQVDGESPVYIDVRTWIEYRVNHIDGDPRIHISELVEGVQQQFPDKKTPIRLYCASGIRSGKGVEKLKQAGYLDVLNVGGIENAKKLRANE